MSGDAARAVDEFLAAQNQGGHRWLIGEGEHAALIQFLDTYVAGLARRLEREQMDAIDPNYDVGYRSGYNMGVQACVKVVRALLADPSGSGFCEAHIPNPSKDGNYEACELPLGHDGDCYSAAIGQSRHA